MNIGWIGTGNMGHGMAERLIKAGCFLYIYNRTAEKAADLLEDGRAEFVESVAGIFKICDIVFSSVTNDDVWGQMLTDAENCIRPGTVFVEMSTLSPNFSAKLKEKMNAKGCKYIDAPVIGSMFMVTAGLLKVIVSGDKEAYEVALPYLQKIGKSVEFLGGGVEARYMKIAVNMLICSYFTIYGEVLLVGETMGFEWYELNDLLENCDGASGMLGDKGSCHRERVWGSTTALTSTALKDLGLALECGTEKGFALPLTAIICQYDRFMHFNKKYESYSTFGTIGMLEDICGVNVKVAGKEGEICAEGQNRGKVKTWYVKKMCTDQIGARTQSRESNEPDAKLSGHLKNTLIAATTLLVVETLRFCENTGIKTSDALAQLATCHGATKYFKNVFAVKEKDSGSANEENGQSKQSLELTYNEVLDSLNTSLEVVKTKGIFLPILAETQQQLNAIKSKMPENREFAGIIS